MSNHKFKFFAVMMSIATVTGAGRAFAEDKPAKKGSKADAKFVDPEEGPRIALRVDVAGRLRQMMDEKMHLSGQQAKEIDRVFADYVDDIRSNYGGHRSGLASRRDNKVLPPTMSQMQREKTAAEAIGDKARVEELNKAMSDRRREPILPGDDHADSLKAKIIPLLKGDQVAQFEKVLERWSAIIPKGPRTGPFQRLRRALRDPEIGLNEKQRRTFDEILKKALMAGRTGKAGSRERIAQEVEKAKVAIFARMSDEQKKKVEADLRLFESVEKNYDDSIDRALAKGVFKKKEPGAKSGKGPTPARTAEPDPSKSEGGEKPATPKP